MTLGGGQHGDYRQGLGQIRYDGYRDDEDGRPSDAAMEIAMDEETFNISIRKFLKMVGINSQREIERAVASAIADGSIKGTESFPAVMTLEIAGLSLRTTFDGEIDLQ